jgi:hypothetical protein
MTASLQIALGTHHFRWPITIVNLASEKTWEAQSLLIRSSHQFPNSSLTAIITLAPLKRNGMRFSLHLSWHHLHPNHRQLQRRQLPQPKRRLHGVDLATPSTGTGNGCTSTTTTTVSVSVHCTSCKSQHDLTNSIFGTTLHTGACAVLRCVLISLRSIRLVIGFPLLGKEKSCAVHGNGSRSLLTHEQFKSFLFLYHFYSLLSDFSTSSCVFRHHLAPQVLDIESKSWTVYGKHSRSPYQASTCFSDCGGQGVESSAVLSQALQLRPESFKPGTEELCTGFVLG